MLGWTVLAAQKPSVATAKCFPPLRSVLRSLESDCMGTEVNTVHVVVCTVGMSEDRRLLQAGGLLLSQR